MKTLKTLSVLIILALLPGLLKAQAMNSSQFDKSDNFINNTDVKKPTKVKQPIHFDVSKELRDVKPIPPGERERSWKNSVIKNEIGFMDEFKVRASYGWTGSDGFTIIKSILTA